MNNKEIREHMDKVYSEYRFSKARKDNVEALRRKHSPTATDLQQRFTI
jgi:hypothetical protein